MRRLVAERGDASLEFAREGYRLSLNPIEDRFDEVGFILWQQAADGTTVPIATGRAAGDELVLDGESAADRELADLEAVIATLIAEEPASPPRAGANET
jgi:hypothetical protein